MTDAVATDGELTSLQLRGVPPARMPRRRARTAGLHSVPQWTARPLAVDACVAVLSAGVALISRYGASSFGQALGANLVVVVLPPVWLVAMSLAGAYDRRVLAVGAEEFRRVCNAGVWLLAAVSVSAFATKAEFSRSLVALTITAVTVLTIASRWVTRLALHRSIALGGSLSRVVVVGSEAETAELVRHMRRFPYSGVSIVGACVPGQVTAVDVLGSAPVPVIGPVSAAADAVRAVDADTIAVAGMSALANGELRRLSWGLEGTGIQLVVAPAITEVAGPRIVVRPVQGLPLLHVDEPRLSGAARVVKWFVDRAGAALLLVLLSPVLLAIAAAVRLTSPGPALFRQARVGRGGKVFVLWKFRTMHVRAEAERLALTPCNEHDGILFKIRRDPRVTPIGRWLRRHSLDELPQLWNVLCGSMSLVGPRPALPDEVARYGADMLRRLLVQPGMTGLWQVGGRGDLSWEEAVRLDLYYVENWSVVLDALILAKTLTTVVVGRGAY